MNWGPRTLVWFSWGLISTMFALNLGCSDPADPTASGVPTPPNMMASDGDVFETPDGAVILEPPDPGLGVDAGGGGNLGDRQPARLETRLQYVMTRAGEPNAVTCDVFDAEGELLVDARPSVGVDPNPGIQRTSEGLVSEVAGVFRVWCVLPAYDLADEEPLEWTVKPGPPARMVTSVDPGTIEAGQRVSVTCRGADVYGNEISGLSNDIRFDPVPERFEDFGGGEFSIQSIGAYRISCVSGGVAQIVSAELVVEPAAASAMTLSLSPIQRVYGLGEMIEVAVEVEDAMGNVIPNPDVRISTSPVQDALGARRFILTDAGNVTIQAVYTGVTDTGAVLEASQEIVVDDGGPSITCLEPAFGEQIEAPAGAMVELTGRVTDIAGVRSVAVNGRAVEIAADGSFRTRVPVSWGVNMHEVLAVDANGEQSSTLCGFFASGEYWSDRELFTDGVMVRFGQNAIDDSGAQRPFTSLGDVIRAVLNSPGLVTFLDGVASSKNPVVETRCRASVLGRCVFSAGLLYESMNIGGPNQVELTLRPGGIRLEMRLENIVVDAQLQGTLDNRGRIESDFLALSANLDIGLGNEGQVLVTLDELSDIEVGDISSDFEGIVTGTLIEAIIAIADTFFRGAIIDSVTDQLTTELSGQLTALLSQFDLSGLTANLAVPSLAGGAGTPLVVVSRLTTVEFDADAGVIGAGLRIDGEAAPGHESLGIAIPPGATALPAATDDASGLVDMVMVNMILHRLWKAGFFESEAGDLVGHFAEGFPGFRVEIEMPVAPAAHGRLANGGLRLSLGPLRGSVLIPALGNDALSFRAGTHVDVDVELLENNGIRFARAEVSNLRVSLDGAALGTVENQGVDALMTEILQGVIDETLSESIPVLPIPAFVTPPELISYGIEEGIVLGLTDANLVSDDRNWYAMGTFGELDVEVVVDEGNDDGLCLETCRFSRDGECDDGGPDSTFDLCALGTDCADCGPR